MSYKIASARTAQWQDYKRDDTQTKRQTWENPIFEKYAKNPVFAQTDAQWLVTNSWKMYWPWVIDARSILGSSAKDHFYMYYSTDHAAGNGGIGLATAPHPLGPWTDYGVVYVDTTVGTQTETPCVVWNPDTSEFHMYYQNKSVGVNQSTLLATSTDGINWTRYGLVIDVPNTVEFTGDGHTGYARVYRLGKTWVANHLMGGGNQPHFGISYSYDGKNWVTDPRSIGGLTDFTEDGLDRRIEVSHSSPFLYRGEMWFVTITSPYVSGSVGTEKKCYIARTNDVRKLVNMYEAVSVGESGEWDNDTIRQPQIIEYNGNLYLFYSAGGTDGNGAIGVAVAEV